LLKTEKEKEKGRIDIDVFEIYNEQNENVFSKCPIKYLVVFNVRNDRKRIEGGYYESKIDFFGYRRHFDGAGEKCSAPVRSGSGAQGKRKGA